MPPEILAFVVVWLLGLVSWVAGLAFHLRARRYYVGPKGFAAFIFPIARLKPSNYLAAGVSLLRWEFRCMAIFLCTVAAGFAISYFQFHGHTR
jgi:hypothetical protein